MDALRQSVEASGAGKKPLLSGDIKIARSANANENEGTVPPGVTRSGLARLFDHYEQVWHW